MINNNRRISTMKNFLLGLSIFALLFTTFIGYIGSLLFFKVSRGIKYLILFVFLTSSLPSFAQTRTDNFFDVSIKPYKTALINVRYFRTYMLGNSDTSYCFSIFLQKPATYYNQNSNISVIAFLSKDEFNLFVDNLTSAYNELLKENKANLTWSTNKYYFSTAINSNQVVFGVPDMAIPDYFTQSAGYAYITKSHIENLLLVLNKINFGEPTTDKQ